MNSYAQLCIVIHTYHYIFALLKAYSTLKVGRWSPCPVLQQPKKEPQPSSSERGVNTLASCWRTGHGDHRPTMICLAHHMNSSLFTSQCHRPTMVCKAIHSPP